MQNSEWGCRVTVLASCKEGCNLNHRRGESSISHFLSHCNYWLGLPWLFLVSSLQMMYINKSHPHTNHFHIHLRPNLSLQIERACCSKISNISFHPEHKWWQNYECYYLNMVTAFWDVMPAILFSTYLWYQRFILWRWKQEVPPKHCDISTKLYAVTRYAIINNSHQIWHQNNSILIIKPYPQDTNCEPH
jgi:hypothetical protein